MLARDSMALNENPRKIASDIAEGLMTFNSSNLRRFDAHDLKVIVENLNNTQRDVRQIIIPMDDPDYMEKTKDKNRKMGRIRNAITVIKNHCYKRGIKGVFGS